MARQALTFGGQQAEVDILAFLNDVRFTAENPTFFDDGISVDSKLERESFDAVGEDIFGFDEKTKGGCRTLLPCSKRFPAAHQV